MDITILTFVCIGALVIFLYLKNKREHYKSKAIKVFLLFVIFTLVLVLLSRYFDIASIFYEDNVVVRTGEAIVDVVRGTLR